MHHHGGVPSSVASTKAAFFVNMLLMCMHVRSHSSNAFADVFLDVVAPCMLALWRDALRAEAPFGNGAGWLAAARLPQGYDDGSLACAGILRVPPSWRMGDGALLGGPSGTPQRHPQTTQPQAPL